MLRGTWPRREAVLRRQDVDLLAVLAEPLVANDPVDLGEKRVIAAHPDILARMDACPQLTHRILPALAT